MKTLIIRKDVTPQDLAVINAGILIIKEKLASIGIPMDFVFMDTDATFIGEETAKGSKAYAPRGTEIVEIAFRKPGYDLYCLMFNWDNVFPHNPIKDTSPFNPTQYGYRLGKGTVISMPLQWYGGEALVFAEFFLHELSHAEYFLNGKASEDQTHHRDHFIEFIGVGAGSKKTNIDFYLFLIMALVAPTSVKKGSKGDVVSGLQGNLAMLGFYKGKVDGDFGPKTDKAVKDFQLANQLLADGVAGKKTWTKIFEEQKKNLK